MKTYLFDASAAVEFYVLRNKSKKIVGFIKEQKKTYRQASLFMPNICVAEVFNTLGRVHTKPIFDV